jgi:hypothetical protein
MRRLAAVAAILVAAVASLADEPTAEKTDPKLPNVPGPFQPYNVTGPFQGRFHSQISQYGLEPMVMIFTREVELSDPLKDLLKQIDNAAEKNPAARLHPFLVVQSDDLPEVVGVGADTAVADKNDDKRIELAQKLEDQAKGLLQQRVDKMPFVLAGKADLAKYNLDDAGFALYLFQRGKVTFSKYSKRDEKLTTEVTAEIMKALADKGGAVRK